MIRSVSFNFNRVRTMAIIWGTVGALFFFCSAFYMKNQEIQDTMLMLAASQKPLNPTPIIGVLTLPCPTDLTVTCFQSYVASSYVKSLESSGARVTAIQYFWDPARIRQALGQINGALLTGGDSQPYESTYTDAARTIFEFANESRSNGVHFPVWGTCLGFETLMVLTSGMPNLDILSNYSAENISLPVRWTVSRQTLARSSLFRGRGSRGYNKDDFPLDPTGLISWMESQPITFNNHKYGVSLTDFYGNSNLTNFWRVLATSKDRDGLTFITIAESKLWPVYAVQFHPEKNPFEWLNSDIPHTTEAIVVSQYLMNFFVRESKKNDQTGLPFQEFISHSGRLSDLSRDFVQAYFW